MGKIECKVCGKQQQCQAGHDYMADKVIKRPRKSFFNFFKKPAQKPLKPSSKECIQDVVTQNGLPKGTLVKKVALVGLPNTGKSQIFSNLTGEYTIVANYPRTTIEVKRTLMKYKDQLYEIIDTPSLHSLYIHSEEEVVVRNLILEEKPDIIVQCIDAFQDKQSLLLTADLLELETPIVIVLNAIDESTRRGIVINSKELETLLGVTVVESIAIRGMGKEDIKLAISKAKKSKARINYGFKIESALLEVMSSLPFEMPFKFKKALLLILMDPFLEAYLEKKHGKEMVDKARIEIGKARRQLKDRIQQDVHTKRHEWVEDICSKVVTKQKMVTELPFSNHFAQACRHPIWGIPILMGFLAIVYFSVTNSSQLTDKPLNYFLIDPTLRWITSIHLPVFWNDFLIGNHGVLTLGVFNAVCTVLPILSVFFFVYGLFEDSGYITNFSVLTKRIFEKVGVTGQAITSIVLGFGCKTMATLTTKGLTSYKEKFITNFLILFAIPCSVQLSINIAILGKFGVVALLIAFGTLGLLEVGAGLTLNLFIKDEKKNYFIQQLPPMRFPSIKGVAIKTYYRIIWFLKEALPIFVISAVGLFAAEHIGLLKIMRQALNPLMVGWLGLPSDMTEIFILAFARREAAAGVIYKMVENGGLNYIQSIVAVVITTTFYPCFASVITLSKEMGIKTAVIMSIMFLTVSFTMAGLLHWALVFVFRG
ncbi:MAG: ferrous iron transporter B [Candidatus Omnitrophica bacterium]|nr:ferrous iron transporter B [Candidatus Omnitrophota bacterium]